MHVSDIVVADSKVFLRCRVMLSHEERKRDSAGFWVVRMKDDVRAPFVPD